jgi:hypothetical protein
MQSCGKQYNKITEIANAFKKGEPKVNDFIVKAHITKSLNIKIYVTAV